MALDWSQCPAVESIPGKVSGAWVFRGTRMPVSTVFDNLEAGASIEDIAEWFDIPPEQIRTVLEFAARSLDAPVPDRSADADSLRPRHAFPTARFSGRPRRHSNPRSGLGPVQQRGIADRCGTRRV